MKLEFNGNYFDFQHVQCQCIAQTSLTHWAQPNILFLQFTPFACTAHIPSLYKALYCTLLFTHQYTDYSVFLSHFILLTIWLCKIHHSCSISNDCNVTYYCIKDLYGRRKLENQKMVKKSFVHGKQYMLYFHF